jgi:putrescine transport system substrate-binding protein
VFNVTAAGPSVWRAFDMMAIPKDAPHPEAALKWINYIEDPKVNAAITNEVYYPTANVPARKFVTPAGLSARRRVQEDDVDEAEAD